MPLAVTLFLASVKHAATMHRRFIFSGDGHHAPRPKSFHFYERHYCLLLPPIYFAPSFTEAADVISFFRWRKRQSHAGLRDAMQQPPRHRPSRLETMPPPPPRRAAEMRTPTAEQKMPRADAAQ